MAFGFFKKVETADLILHNGHIYTQDSMLPWAEAVAVKGERIMGVGNFENMDGIIGKDTTIVDLEGKYVFPGFIDVHRSPVLKVFKDKYVDLSGCTCCEEILEAVSEWAEDNPDAEVVFGYGYRDDLKPVAEDEAALAAEFEAAEGAEAPQEAYAPSSMLLSQACDDRPVVLLAANNIDCWTNCTADRIIVETAEEEVVETITVNYVLNLFIPFDFEEVEMDVKAHFEELADQGFTSVLNLQAPDYFENLYQDSVIGLFNEGQMRQRFFGSYFMNRPLLPKGVVHRLMTRKTNCLELGNMVHADMLNVYLDNEDCPVPFSQEALNHILGDACERGFDIFVEAVGKVDLLMAYEAHEHVRTKGFKGTFVIASDYDLAQEQTAELMYWESAIKTWGTEADAATSLSGNISNVSEAVDHLTTVAAEIIGMADHLGSLESGKLADMSVFDENLLELSPEAFSREHACMTIVGGEIVYDAEAENDMEMYTLMSMQHL